MNGILRNWKILPAPSEKNLPLQVNHFQKVTFFYTRFWTTLSYRRLFLRISVTWDHSGLPLPPNLISLHSPWYSVGNYLWDTLWNFTVKIIFRVNSWNFYPSPKIFCTSATEKYPTPCVFFMQRPSFIIPLYHVLTSASLHHQNIKEEKTKVSDKRKWKSPKRNFYFWCTKLKKQKV